MTGDIEQSTTVITTRSESIAVQQSVGLRHIIIYNISYSVDHSLMGNFI